MRRRIRTSLALAVTATLAVPFALAGTAQADEPSPSIDAVDDPRALARAVTEAVDAAAHLRTRSLAAPESPVENELDAALEAAAAGIPVGVTARVETPGLRWSGAAGIRELDRPAPARTGDRFRAGSITKTMVATLVLQEVERGTWSLDTPIVEVLPRAAEIIPPTYHDAVTIEQLLSHRSGLPDHLMVLLAGRITDPNDLDEQFAVMGQEYTTADHLAAMRLQPWLFEPGTSYSYSNAGYVLIGLALEEATGQELESLLEKRVFRPARMAQTDYPDDPESRGNLLVDAAYTGDLGAGWYSLGHVDPSLFDAAGAVTSTTADLHRFTGALFGGELMDPATVAEMTTPRSDDSYGLGVYRLPDPCTPGQWLYGHDGATFGALSITLASPDGERQFSVGLTGRDYVGDLGESMIAVLVPMLTASC